MCVYISLSIYTYIYKYIYIYIYIYIYKCRYSTVVRVLVRGANVPGSIPADVNYTG